MNAEQLTLISVPASGPQFDETKASAVERARKTLRGAPKSATLYEGDTYRVCEVRACVVREDRVSAEARVMNRAELCAQFWREVIASGPWFDPEKECVAVVIVDRKNRVTAWNVVSVGSLSASLMHPREVLRAVLVAGGSAFIVMHNHPSGDPAPSAPDLQVTRQIRDAAKIVDVPFMDHVIVGRAGADPMGRGHYSFRESGML